MGKVTDFIITVLVICVMRVVLGGNVPVLSKDVLSKDAGVKNKSRNDIKYFHFTDLVDPSKDTSEFWRETEILSLIQNTVPYQEMCDQSSSPTSIIRFPSRRTVRTICKGKDDQQVCPQCPHYNNFTECELFRDSCKEPRVLPLEYRTYCDKKYGKWRTMFLPADYKQCRCCDDCVFYRELDQSCIADEYSFDTDEFLPVTTIDFRAGCNPYWGHPDQELKALRCDKVLRRCVPVTLPPLSNEPVIARRSYRYEPPSEDLECPMSCRGYQCPSDHVTENQCQNGAFLPDSNHCNCCGKCSHYRQLNQKCAEFKKTFLKVNNTEEIEVEEEFLEPGCDDGLVCRQGKCQDIHNVRASVGRRSKRDEGLSDPKEPCKEEMKKIKKKYGPDGAFHFDAPQCTPLWLYAPVQCRGFVCRCALEDGTYIEGIKVPRIEVPNMNCDCAREKCRSLTDIECDGYGNYKEAMFTPHVEKTEERDKDEAPYET